MGKKKPCKDEKMKRRNSLKLGMCRWWIAEEFSGTQVNHRLKFRRLQFLSTNENLQSVQTDQSQWVRVNWTKCSEAVVGILHVDPSDAFSFLLTVSSQSHQSLESRREPSASLGRPLSIFSKSKSILPLADQCVETKVWRKTKKRCQVLDTILGSLTVSAARERIDRTPRSLDSYAHCLT